MTSGSSSLDTDGRWKPVAAGPSGAQRAASAARTARLEAAVKSGIAVALGPAPWCSTGRWRTWPQASRRAWLGLIVLPPGLTVLMLSWYEDTESGGRNDLIWDALIGRHSVNRVFDDLRHRRNVDIYVTIMVAMVVSALSLGDVIGQDQLVPLTLAVLAVMAYSTMATRDIIAGESDSTSEHSILRVCRDFPPDLSSRREASQDTLLIGVGLSRTLESSFGAFKTILASGGRIRVVLTDPQASEAALDARCQLTSPIPHEIRTEIRQSLAKLTKLASGGGNIEVRLTRTALKFGLNYVDIGRASATMYVQLYGFRLQGESRPIVVLRARRDREWFECYRQQAEHLWEAAAPRNLNSPEAGLALRSDQRAQALVEVIAEPS